MHTHCRFDTLQGYVYVKYMHARYIAALLIALAAPAFAQRVDDSILASPPRQMTREQRRELIEVFSQKTAQELEHARAIAKTQGWSFRGVTNGMEYDLEAIVDGKVYMTGSDNRDAGITAASDQIRDMPFGLTGTGIVVGIWEAGGHILSNHQEYTGRIIHMDPPDVSLSLHASHVAGTLAASGVSNLAAGMAPLVQVYSRNSSTDEVEMIAMGMANPGETNVIQLSCHSYSTRSGWSDSYTPPRWYGLWLQSESDNFGIYEFQTRYWDVIAYGAPYYLIFKSSGNNRDDTAPAENDDFQFFSNSTWMVTNYASAVHPPDDGWDDGGYDTITPKGGAKNIMTCGAVNDAENGGGPRIVTNATMTDFSGWGPTDDGRIKPDIVANGRSLFSSYSTGSTSDYNRLSGTSMATPSACGSAALLLELYGQLFTNNLLSSSLKGILLHTTDDLGRTGPDYIFGWGLLNARNAAEHLIAHYHNANALRLVEDTVTDVDLTNTYSFTWQSNGTIKATLCWTDPPGPFVTQEVDNTELRLVNDLDLRLIDADGVEHFPWVLDPLTPTNPATTGTNFRDNVEQVCLTNATSTGVWTVVVSSDAVLTDGEQTYSLLVTGHDDSVDDYIRFVSDSAYEDGFTLHWSSLTGKTYEISRATNLLDPSPFSTTLGTVTGNYLSTSYTDTTATTEGPYMYRVEEQ